MRGAFLSSCVLAFGCGASEPATSTDAATDGAGDAAPRLSSVVATIRYAGTQRAPLAVGLFTENPPKTKPPVSFDTTNTPTFPYVAQLRDVEPGRYWVVAVLDLPPVSPGAVTPGAEDLQAISIQIDVERGKDGAVEVTLTDKP